jgi:two-component system response regulator AtoC
VSSGRPVGEFAEDNRDSIVTHAESKSTRNCLVVDDEPRLRQALSRLLKSDGFTTFEAGSGEEALTILGREPIALVLSDMRMPGMTGSELLREVRLRHPDIAFVLITAVAEVVVAVE